jgi:xanthine dehydrogenase YagS FAD-binding subunit
MHPFQYRRAASADDAVASGQAAAFLAGGTTLIDLMKQGVMRPQTLVDIGGLAPRHAAIRVDSSGLHLGALATMAEVAAHRDVRHEYPVVAQSLTLAASAQLRNMATLGGNVLQRTRCGYFRDPSWAQCNKRVPGSGCAALEGVNRKHAVLGTSAHCIATYPGDFAQALVALDASVEILGPGGVREEKMEALHLLPGETPERETALAPGELILGFSVPARAWVRRSLYLKIRDRQSYEFALTSAAVALDLADGRVREARIALGGVATKPWRARAAEAALVGKELDEAAAATAARIAFQDAQTRKDNAQKPELGRRTLVRALLAAARMEV